MRRREWKKTIVLCRCQVKCDFPNRETEKERDERERDRNRDREEWERRQWNTFRLICDLICDQKKTREMYWKSFQELVQKYAANCGAKSPLSLRSIGRSTEESNCAVRFGIRHTLGNRTHVVVIEVLTYGCRLTVSGDKVYVKYLLVCLRSTFARDMAVV